MLMNLSYLKYVVEVGRVQSITKAAQNLYMGQPNLSKAIKELEKEIGITIFRRSAKGVVPTPKGKEFLGYAQGILSQIDELESLYKPRSENALELSIAMPRSANSAMIFAEFLSSRENPEHIDIHFEETGAINAVHLVAGGEMDLGIIRYQASQAGYFMKLIEQSGLESEVLGEFRMQLLMSEDHPLASEAEVQYHMLAGCTEIVHGDYPAPSLSFSQIRRGAGLEAPLKRITVYDRGSQYDLLRYVPGSFLWSAPVPQELLSRSRLVLKPCALADVKNLDVLIRPAGAELSEAAGEFVEKFRESVHNPANIPEPPAASANATASSAKIL